MGRALAAVGGLLVLCLAVLLGAVLITRDEDQVAVDNLLAERVTRAFTLAGPGDEIVLADFTSFSWDRVLVVERGTPRAVVSRALGSEFKGELNYDAESPALLVFAEGRRLARFADYRGRLQFAGLERPVEALTPAEAVFVVRGALITPSAGSS
jgi:hypothetical protein